MPTSVLKNAGLAHMHLVRHPQLSLVPVLRQPSYDHFGTRKLFSWPSLPAEVMEGYERGREGSSSDDDGDSDSSGQAGEYSESALKEKYSYDWKGWSAERFMHHWGLFLARDDAKRDSQYSTIAQIHSTVAKAKKNGSNASQPGRGGSGSGSGGREGDEEAKPKKKRKRRAP